jgi:hypothetical protein
MSYPITLTTALYPRETLAEFESLAQTLVDQYQPATFDEWEVVGLLANAAWLKQRYTWVRDQLYLQRNSLPEDDGRRWPIEQSIENFNREVNLQREQLASLRRQWRQISRSTIAPREESSHVLVPAA